MNYGLYILIATYLVLYNMYYDGYLVKTIQNKSKIYEDVCGWFCRVIFIRIYEKTSR